jgi:uncharacterized membrane protein YkgB
MMTGKPFPAGSDGVSEDDRSPFEGTSGDHEGLVVSEVQLLLAEKRTSLAALRTGIAVFVLPLSVLSVLIATSNYYDVIHVLPFIIPLLSLSAALVILASYLIIRSLMRMRHQDRMILGIKRKHPMLAPFID